MLRYDVVVNEAKTAIPEFKEKYDSLIKENILDEDDGVHIVFGYAFVPVLLDAIQKKNEALIKRMFDFLELMVKSPDKECGAVCDFSVLEAINGEVPDEVLYSYMGPETRLDFEYMKDVVGYLA